MAFRPSVFSFQLLPILLLQITTATASPSPDVCRHKCGDLSIPYPFGIGPEGAGCFRDGLQVHCDNLTGSATPTAFFSRDPQGFLKIGSVVDISLLQGQARIRYNFTSKCYNISGGVVSSGDPELDLTGTPFMVNSTRNKVTTIGCDTVGTIIFTGTIMFTGPIASATGCVSFCHYFDDSMSNYFNDSITSGSCTGAGCCQSTIPRNMDFFMLRLSELSNHSLSAEFNPCTYTFVADQDEFNFTESDLYPNIFEDKYKDGVPLVLDWVAGNETCNEAKNNHSSYACLSSNSICIDSTYRHGYLCNCSKGFQGNPYIENGCIDINECEHPDQYPCRGGTCRNIPGDYNCSCPIGYSSKEPKTEECVPDSEPDPSIKIVIGLSVGLFCFLGFIFWMILARQRRKLHREKDKFFQQNGGWRLYEEIRSKQVDTVKIYTKEDLEKATDNFNKDRELGRGGHGTVYKGNLEDGREVAIKRSKVVTEDQSEEFVREMIILSQINHKNVLRLLGCCLEVEIPMLVYEFIPNGTLFDFIHGNDSRLIPLATRLRIAGESAEALAYLHSWASPPILHGDVKSLNILLDRNYVPKVSDFGASRMLSLDETQFVTMIQGTLGYLDPEFLLVRQLTAKSDVYSFGVVMVELITRKKAIYLDGSGEGTSLAFSFVEATKDDRLEEILDDQVIGETSREILREIAELAVECLNVRGDERPTMREVAERLRTLRGFLQQPSLMEHIPEECERLLGESSIPSAAGTTVYYSLQNKMSSDIEVGR